MIDMVRNDLVLYTNHLSIDKILTNVLPRSVQHFSKRNEDKPSVFLRSESNGDESMKALVIEALLDPASYKTSSSSSEDMILSYITRKLANIYANHEYALTSCDCRPATTCTSTGCFITHECLTIECTLFDEKATIKNIFTSFRVVETLGTNDISSTFYDPVHSIQQYVHLLSFKLVTRSCFIGIDDKLWRILKSIFSST